MGEWFAGSAGICWAQAALQALAVSVGFVRGWGAGQGVHPIGMVILGPEILEQVDGGAVVLCHWVLAPLSAQAMVGST